MNPTALIALFIGGPSGHYLVAADRNDHDAIIRQAMPFAMSGGRRVTTVGSEDLPGATGWMSSERFRERHVRSPSSPFRAVDRSMPDVVLAGLIDPPDFEAYLSFLGVLRRKRSLTLVDASAQEMNEALEENRSKPRVREFWGMCNERKHVPRVVELHA